MFYENCSVLREIIQQKQRLLFYFGGDVINQFDLFMRENKVKREATFYAASQAFIGESGEPVLWKIRPISTRENENIRAECVVEELDRNSGRMRSKFDIAKYTSRLLAASVEEPNLFDKKLQDSYGVLTPEDLLLELLDNPAEYRRFADFVQRFNGFDVPLDERVERAKN